MTGRNAPLPSVAQIRVLQWMGGEGRDRALYKCRWSAESYGQYSTGARFRRIASRRTVECLIRLGLVAWMQDSPHDLRAALTSAGFDLIGQPIPDIVKHQDVGGVGRARIE